ncbi:MAG: hypothetical protein NTW80_12675 [Deltaproteobacteria bacterium]|nr:hypothetical protein [Deltaproteobacteria bacterium]
MNRVIKISAWLAVWLFIASALVIFPGAAAVAQSLDIRIQSEDRGSPPGDLVLTDPAGDRMGPYAPAIQLPNPLSGLYHLRVIGREIGVYTLYLKAYSDRGSTSDVRFPHMTIQDGEVHHYRIYFSARGPKLDVRRTRVTQE